MYAILDIEATGGKVGEESIIEVAVYKYDGKEIIDQFISLVNPEKKIDQYVQRLTHITDKMVLTAPKFHEVAKRIVEITDDCILVGHNVMFDYRMLKQEFNRLGYNFQKEWIDTFEYSEKLIPGLPSYSLGKLCQSLGIVVTDRHRASGDARATVALFKMLIDKDSQKIIIKKTGLNQPKKAHSKYQKLLEGLPNSIGVFYLYNSKKQLIYISRSNNIAGSVNQIFTSKTLKANKLKRYTRSIKYEETGSGFLSAIKENSEVLNNQPMYNTKLVENKVYPFGLYLLASKRGYSRLEIGKVRKVQPVLKFKTKERAKEVLEKIVNDYNLCKQVNAGVKSDDSCFQYKVNKCNGACIKEESRDVYNKRIEDFILTTEYPSDTFLILDKGRKGTEKSFYLVEKGEFKGYGYYEFHHQIKSLEKIHNILIPIQETDEIKNMLKYFLYKVSSNPNQIIVLDEL
ncbi:DNA polymerase III subunit epsilon [Empedobacter brevis]|uniref:Exonuclease n=2 Tax=Empedobacter brevis TaxID=247 RepID=A0A511NG66_9FLAO|nr:exonuclease domain-containing protein [Empedobacter brevis]MDM1072713.1 DNA polymerase III subunit epsilon [Empedobacter brevis]QES92733.1 DNA polymerase III subunit epsilon [Empedobacter brevis]QHC84488.1 DNA polymerase III subunit epsilon [Empedobacter brevis]GEM51627.1 exonuclease [Empedobacter brevis NBRC 14943 = ATCC 43319]